MGQQGALWDTVGLKSRGPVTEGPWAHHHHGAKPRARAHMTE